MSIDSITNDTIAAGIFGAYPREANGFDYAYWTGKKRELYDRGVELSYRGTSNSPDFGFNYFWDKLIGWQATGADAPTFGPFANPPSPLRLLTRPAPTPAPAPAPEPDPEQDTDPLSLAALIEAIDDLTKMIDDLRADIRANTDAATRLSKSGLKVHI
jgi:hypothetical protein